jgi:hypothetical protein
MTIVCDLGLKRVGNHAHILHALAARRLYPIDPVHVNVYYLDQSMQRGLKLKWYTTLILYGSETACGCALVFFLPHVLLSLVCHHALELIPCMGFSSLDKPHHI